MPTTAASTRTTLGTILLVDSEEHITSLLRINLESESFDVEVEASALHASTRDLTSIRLMLIDAMEQAFTGRDLLRQVKANPLTAHIPVIILTHSDSEDDIIDAFSEGAEDYILKPFSLRELVARVKSVLRRHPQVVRAATNGAILTHDTLEVDLLNRTVRDDGILLPLTKTEFAILALLMKNKGTFFNRRQIFDQVWASAEHTDNDRIVDTNISRLRKKLGRASASLVNRSGMGYAII